MQLAPHILSQGNWLSMDRFMDLVLFDEAEGYYSSQIPAIGYRGDFATSASQSSLLARALVAEWKEACRDCGRTLPFLEIGGGSGDLMMAISRELGFFGRLRARYLMVDRSAKLREFQRMVGGGFVRSYETIQQALKACKGRAFIFSNELPDAFPARQFVFQEGEWMELGLAVVDRQIIRQAANCAQLPESSAFARWAQEGQVIEVHESYHQWYASWQAQWRCGRMVTVDYGDEVERLYYRRPQGSMRGYKAHQMLGVEEILPMAGKCDVTCDVNFSDLRELAERCSEDGVRLMSQREFLLPFVKAGEAADAHLVAVPGAGDYFRVLVSRRFEL